MPDIAMCANRLCPLRPDCYRARAVPDEHRQSYMMFTFAYREKGPPGVATCRDFYPIERGHRLHPDVGVPDGVSEVLERLSSKL